MKMYISIIAMALVAELNAQNVNFPGVVPSLSLTAVVGDRFDINVLAISKSRLGEHAVDNVQYPQRVLEIYGQVSVNYKLSTWWQLGAGYGFQRNNPFDDSWRNEHRLVQQALLVIPVAKSKLLNRFRLEERWFGYPDAPAQFATRARYLFGYVKPLKGNMVYWQINNELYAATSGSRNAFISENWCYTGVGFTVNAIGHIETGIGYNTVVQNRRHDLNSLFLLQVAWSYTLPSDHTRQMHPAMHARHF